METLPVFDASNWEEHVSRWSELEQQEGVIRLEKGSVVASIAESYGEKEGVDKFAYEVGEGSARTLREYAQVYRRLWDLDDDARDWIVEALTGGALMYSHVRIAVSRVPNSNPEMVDILAEALDGQWRVKRLLEELEQRKAPRANAPEKDQTEPETEDGYDLVTASVVEDGEAKPDSDFVDQVEDMEVHRMLKNIEEVCEVLRGRDSSYSLAHVRRMRQALQSLEEELEKQVGNEAVLQA